MNVRKFFNLLIVFAISLMVYQIIRQLYDPYWQELADSTFRVLAGKPDWLAYQNRLLAPFLVSIITSFGVSQVSALKIFVLFMVVGQNVLLFLLFSTSKEASRNAIFAVLAYTILFLFVQEYRLYPWDYVDIFLFTFFAWGVFERKSLLFFVLLFFVAILNRESALFISLYMALDAFEIDGKLILKSKTKLITGIALTIAGILFVIAIREFLFISQPGGFNDSKHELIGNHFNLLKNLNALFVGNIASFQILNSLFLLGSMGYVLTFLKHKWKAVLIYLVLLLNILIFGVVNESRLYGILLPFLIFFLFNFGDTKAETASL
ncbi:MAG: hypothetical protein KJZ72_04805 [Anaerolineales bacterium]|nr:hypothetical protein [Anaerolineales bacterium]